MSARSHYILLLILNLWSLSISAQESTLLSPSTIELVDSLSGVQDYSSTHREWTLKKFELQEPQTTNTIQPPSGGLIAGAFIKYLVYLFIVLALVVLIILVLKGNKTHNPEINTEFNSLETEEELIRYDTDSVYAQAIKDKNYRLALRMQFIRVLQVLTVKKAILWKPEKTNRDYSRELRGQDDFTHFKTLSSAFERVWYGNKAITEQEFHQYDSHFAHYLNQQL